MAAQNGIAVFYNPRSGERKHVSFYLDDTTGNLVRFDESAKAGAASSDSWTPGENMVLEDFCIAAASGQTTTQLIIGGAPTGDYLLNAVYLASINTRPKCTKLVPAGVKFQAKQLA